MKGHKSMKILLGDYDKFLFRLTIILVVPLCAFAMIATETFQSFWSALNQEALTKFGWMYILSAGVCLPFSLAVAFSRIGNLKLGRPDEEPEYSTFTWVAMLVSSGIGVGVYFWSVSEPMFHYMQTPYLAEPGTEAAMAQALAITFFHWGFHGWAIFITMGLAVAYAAYRLGQPLSFSAALYGILGEKTKGPWGTLLNQLCSFITVVGIASIIGLGILSLTFVVGDITGLETTATVKVLMAIVLAIIYTSSAAAGLTKGMARMSDLNIIIAIFILLFVFFVGPTNTIINNLINGFGAYLDNLMYMSFWIDTTKGADSWSAGWTLYYWSWWLAWTPFMGGFVARISKGRTVRQVLLTGISLPSLMMIVWFGIMGGAGFDMQNNGPVDLWASIQSQVESGIFVMLEAYPLGKIIVVVSLISLVLFQVTSGDAGVNYVSILFAKGNPNPTVGMKLTCAVIVSLLPISMILGGGLKAVQIMTLVLALPLTIVLVLALVSIVGMYRHDPNAQADLKKS